VPEVLPLELATPSRPTGSASRAATPGRRGDAEGAEDARVHRGLDLTLESIGENLVVLPQVRVH
jgi:hypothetical protein